MTNIDIPSPVAEFIDAVNAGDETAFLDAFTSDGFIDDWGRVFGDRAAMQGWSAKEFIGAKGVLTPETVAVDGDTVTVVGDWRSTHANGRSEFTFAVDGDRLKSMTIREG
ncbi:nuclear transport factor 2 family protein [Tsukamurella conjunctivitidis]|uniref:Nuclear transport factor 2 family protein n=3 Tax=Tsukamurellaceae TaxID=85028 RepID=A0A5C5S126_9ACTN|nr:nuclear transport factor 2 family protein [Tsukamurella conjunctivitidis]NMD54184.1 nuclear transport factor 2 family protein [Tsukamurella columbiensis]TWS28373.1 nuclear transport factor 2 family protein [Tsukamurella conjunctivitidis]